VTKAEKLRALFNKKPILKIVGAHNALGAKLIEKHDFDGVWSSGFEIATAHGVPDANILTMTENLDASININTGTHLPVICDCDTGFGNALNVMHMVRKYESVGMAAVTIEDKRFPKMNSFIPGRQELAPIDEFVGKLQAAQQARSTVSGIMIFARIEALIAGWGMEEALKRALAYAEAGADGIVIHSKSDSPKEIFEFARAWQQQGQDCPLICIPTMYYTATAEELADAGFKMVIYANQGIRASVRHMDEIFGRIAFEGSTKGIEHEIASMGEIFGLQGMSRYCEDEKRYGTSSTEESIQALIPAAGDHRYQTELSPLLQDKPLCMLEIAGKTLLERQIELLRSVGIKEFSVVVGHQQDKIKVEGAQFIENCDFDSKKSAHSIMLGLDKSFGKTLICYADIIFDKQIPELLIQSTYDITIVMDRAFRSLPRRDKKLDLVLTNDSSNLKPTRKMELERFKYISKIGKIIDVSKADYEFIGMMLFSKHGLEILKAAWSTVQKEFSNKRFYESPNAYSASMTDLLQFLIDRGTMIFGLVVEHGWSEVYSLDDYERLKQYFTENKIGAPSLSS